MKTTLLVTALVFAVGSSVNAATMSVSLVAPTVDGDDIAQLVGLSDNGGDQGHLWSNRPDQGQTFTTGADPLGYNLDSVTLLARVDQGSTTSPNWEIRVGSVVANVFNPLSIENAAGVAIPNTGGTANPQWVTWQLDTPIMLDPNTVYGFDAYPSGSGFITLNNAGDVYAGGTAISNDDNLPASPPNPLTLRNFDRVFHLDLAAKAAPTPEPSTFILATLGLLSLGMTRRRRRR